MEKQVDVAVIGAGSAGLSALREIRRETDNFVVINDGPHGTTCARVGCMPSKVLIQAANDFHRRHSLSQEGISGGESLKVDIPSTMKHVRALRDRFVKGVLETVEGLGDKCINGRATFIDTTVLKVGHDVIHAKKIILATGSAPIIPKEWMGFRDRLLTTDEFFEQEDFPEKMAVLGLGVIGLELGQALSRLGIDVVGVGRSERVGGLTDPKIYQYAVEKINQEFPLWQGAGAELKETPDGKIEVHSQGRLKVVDKVLLALGRRPNLLNLGLDSVGVQMNDKGMPNYDEETMQMGDLPIFIAGDVNGDKAILHEASDEGRIAGYNSVREKPSAFERRAWLGVTFCDPNICTVGLLYNQLPKDRIAVGEVSFEGQGRSIVMLKEKGILRVYGDKKTSKILGAEMMAPSGEHIAHLLSWAIQMELTIHEILSMPFYHPVVEEGLRTALRDLREKMNPKFVGMELLRYQ